MPDPCPQPVPSRPAAPGQPRPIEKWLDTLAGKGAVPLVTADEAAYESAVMDGLYKAAASKAWEPVMAKP